MLTLANLPSNAFGIPVMGPNQLAPLPFGDGVRCIGGTLRRYPVVKASPEGVATLGPGIVALSQALFPPEAHIAPGSTWNFMHWYRDPSGPCGTTYSGTNALAAWRKIGWSERPAIRTSTRTPRRAAFARASNTRWPGAK